MTRARGRRCAAGENENRLNYNQRAYWLVQVSHRWYGAAVRKKGGRGRATCPVDAQPCACGRRGVHRRLSLRLEILGALISFGAALFAVLGKHNGIDPGEAGDKNALEARARQRNTLLRLAPRWTPTHG